MTLPYDVARCSGRFTFMPDDEVCKQRDTCQRYAAFSRLDTEAGLQNYRGIPVQMATENCGIKIEAEP